MTKSIHVVVEVTTLICYPGLQPRKKSQSVVISAPIEVTQ
jgi:hypothetical protein